MATKYMIPGDDYFRYKYLTDFSDVTWSGLEVGAATASGVDLATWALGSPMPYVGATASGVVIAIESEYDLHIMKGVLNTTIAYGASPDVASVDITQSGMLIQGGFKPEILVMQEGEDWLTFKCLDSVNCKVKFARLGRLPIKRFAPKKGV